jgi:hypothetical protein
MVNLLGNWLNMNNTTNIRNNSKFFGAYLLGQGQVVCLKIGEEKPYDTVPLRTVPPGDNCLEVTSVKTCYSRH